MILMMPMLKLKKFLKIFNIMPVKKKESEIFYVHKNVSDCSLHPTMIGCRDIFVNIKVFNKNGDAYSSPCHLNVETELNNSTNGVNLSKISDYFLSRTFLNIENLFTEVEDKFLTEFKTKKINVKIDFPYFSTKQTPVSNKKCLYKYDCSFYLNIDNQEKHYFVEVVLPYSSLCPTSKEISDYGAHNQRGSALFKVEIDNLFNKKTFWIEDLIDILDSSCSSPVYNLTNLQDEAYQTELMYENALFIEEIAQNASDKLKNIAKEKGIRGFLIELSQKESINTYENFVKIEYGVK